MDIKNKVVVVTGGSKGIGLALAKKLLSEGAKVVVYSCDIADAKSELTGENALLIEGDVTNRDQARNAFKEIKEKFGEWDVLVNNAAIAVKKDLLRTTDEEWDRIFEVNTKGVYIMIQEALRGIEFGRGRMIINISSGVGIHGVGGLAAYSASKAAVINLTQSLAQELEGKNIECITITPGSTHTDMFTSLFPDREARHKPEEVAEVIYKTITGEIKPDERLIVDVFEHAR